MTPALFASSVTEHVLQHPAVQTLAAALPAIDPAHTADSAAISWGVVGLSVIGSGLGLKAFVDDRRLMSLFRDETIRARFPDLNGYPHGLVSNLSLLGMGLGGYAAALQFTSAASFGFFVMGMALFSGVIADSHTGFYVNLTRDVNK